MRLIHRNIGDAVQSLGLDRIDCISDIAKQFHDTRSLSKLSQSQAIPQLRAYVLTFSKRTEAYAGTAIAPTPSAQEEKDTPF